jgi:hypothetical protein
MRVSPARREDWWARLLVKPAGIAVGHVFATLVSIHV